MNSFEHFWVILTAIAAGLTYCIHKIRKIFYEVTNNGGKSMKDAVDKVALTVDNLLANQQKMLKGQAINTKRTQLLWEHNNQGYYECNGPDSEDEGACTYANERLCNLFGLTLDTFLGWGWLGSIETQAERTRIHKSWLAAVEDDIPYAEEYYILTAGKRVKVRTRAWACRDEHGAVLKMFGTLEEVKE